MADDKPLPQIEYPYAPRPAEARNPATLEAPPSSRNTGKPAKESDFSSHYVCAIAALMLTVSAIINVVALPVVEAIDGPDSPWDIIVVLGLGLIGSQMLALSSALVWSNRPFLLRLVILWLIGMALYGCWYLGVEFVLAGDHPQWFRDHRRQEARAILASLFAVSLAIQAPQWLVRFYFDWTVAGPAPTASSSPARKMSIRDFLIGTTVAALTVAPMRLAVEKSSDITTEFWAGWAIAVAILAAISAVVNLPLLFLVLRLRDPIWALAFICLGSPILGGVIIAIIVSLEPGGGGPNAWNILMFLLAVTSCVAATSLPLWLARLKGCRLAFRGDVPAVEEGG